MTNKRNIWLTGPYLVWIAGFIVLPLLVILFYAFTNPAGNFTFSNITAAVICVIEVQRHLQCFCIILISSINAERSC